MKIIDSHFAHAKSAGSPYQDIFTSFKWERNFNQLNNNEYIFFTDSAIYEALKFKYHNKILWVLESPALVSSETKDIISINYQHFVKILTHDDDLLKLPNAICFPVGGCWIYENDCQIYKKNINKASLIISQKKFSEGQKLRQLIAQENLTENFGYDYKKLNYKLDSLKDYKFHVCIENYKNEFYFTEKIIDCFATGTIPIYWGCKNIDTLFNSKGIIAVDNYYELKFVLNNLDSIQINSEIIEENFEISKEFWLPEKRIEKLFSCR